MRKKSPSSIHFTSSRIILNSSLMSCTISIIFSLAPSLKCLVTYNCPTAAEKLPAAVETQVFHLGVSSVFPEASLWLDLQLKYRISLLQKLGHVHQQIFCYLMSNLEYCSMRSLDDLSMYPKVDRATFHIM